MGIGFQRAWSFRSHATRLGSAARSTHRRAAGGCCFCTELRHARGSYRGAGPRAPGTRTGRISAGAPACGPSLQPAGRGAGDRITLSCPNAHSARILRLCDQRLALHEAVQRDNARLIKVQKCHRHKRQYSILRRSCILRGLVRGARDTAHRRRRPCSREQRYRYARGL
jgi:hypothetical protein